MPGRTFFPNLSKFITFAAAPTSVDPIRPRPIGPRALQEAHRPGEGDLGVRHPEALPGGAGGPTVIILIVIIVIIIIILIIIIIIIIIIIMIVILIT